MPRTRPNRARVAGGRPSPRGRRRRRGRPRRCGAASAPAASSPAEMTSVTGSLANGCAGGATANGAPAAALLREAGRRGKEHGGEPASRSDRRLGLSLLRRRRRPRTRRRRRPADGRHGGRLLLQPARSAERGRGQERERARPRRYAGRSRASAASRRGPPGSRRAEGRSVTRNPPSGRFSAAMRPPCSSTIFLAIASPSPVPPLLAEKYGIEEPRKDLAERRPGPSSSTATRRPLAVAPGGHADLPRGVRRAPRPRCRAGSRRPGRAGAGPPAPSARSSIAEVPRARPGAPAYAAADSRGEAGDVRRPDLGRGQPRVVGELRRGAAQLVRLAQHVRDALLEDAVEIRRTPRRQTSRRCSTESRIGVSGFLISCAMIRAISAHAARRFERTTSETSSMHGHPRALSAERQARP